MLLGQVCIVVILAEGTLIYSIILILLRERQASVAFSLVQVITHGGLSFVHHITWRISIGPAHIKDSRLPLNSHWSKYLQCTDF